MPTLFDPSKIIPFPQSSETTDADETMDVPQGGTLLPLPVVDAKSATLSLTMKRTLKDITEHFLEHSDPIFIKVVDVERYTRSRTSEAYSISCRIRLGNGRIYTFTAENKPSQFRSWSKGIVKHTVPMERFSLVREPSILDSWFPMMGISRPLAETSPESLHLTLMDLSAMVDNGVVRHLLMEGKMNGEFAHIREHTAPHGRVSRTAHRSRHLFHLLKKAVDRHMSSLN